eukprot:356427-Chlamydomonas_euryale.AAC.2
MPPRCCRVLGVSIGAEALYVVQVPCIRLHCMLTASLSHSAGRKKLGHGTRAGEAHPASCAVMPILHISGDDITAQCSIGLLCKMV